tara:strand:- start:119 stop:313 length:195 start_codon:yes stop_codon:yes gene_type:complete
VTQEIKVHDSRLIAVVDGNQRRQDVGLYWGNDDELTIEIEWPTDWPEQVSAEFLKSQGFDVVYA